METKGQNRSFWLFGGLMVYIIAQFIWWTVLLLRRDEEIDLLRMQVAALSGTGEVEMMGPKRMVMVIGEAGMFLLLLLVVLALSYRAIRRDLDLARTQRNFLLAVTHELRTPIAAIKLQLQTIARRGLDPGQYDALRQSALAEADRLALLTDKVLLATTAEEGAVPLRTGDLEVMGLLRSVVERNKEQHAERHGLTLNGPPAMVVHSDAHALRSIVDNLIENATKYAPPGTAITIDAVKGRNGWRITVSDEGPGIPAIDHDRVFDRFYRGGAEETRGASGTGLGLYIVRRLVQRLGGTIQLQDRAPHGAIFVASFPDR